MFFYLYIYKILIAIYQLIYLFFNHRYINSLLYQIFYWIQHIFRERWRDRRGLTDRQTDKHTEKQTDRDTKKETEGDRNRETQTYKQERETERDKESNRERERQIDRERNIVRDQEKFTLLQKENCLYRVSSLIKLILTSISTLLNGMVLSTASSNPSISNTKKWTVGLPRAISKL